MKYTIKLIVTIVVVIVLLGVAQSVFNFNIGDIISNYFEGTKLKSVRTNMSKAEYIPVFQIVSLEIFYPKNLSIIEASKNEWWKLNIGTVFVLVEYDSLVKLGVRNPHSIKMRRERDTIYIDESTIVIELLDTKLSNYHYVRTFYSNISVQNKDSEKYIFDAINLMESELITKMIEDGQANFEYAKKNFKENYQNLCNSMGLEVVWE